MILADKVLGRSATEKLRARPNVALLVVGGDVFTRHALGALDCYPARSLATLNAQLKALEVKNTRDLYTRVAPREVVAFGVGPISVAVLGVAFEVKELGTLDTWVRKHSAVGAKVVTVDTMKHQDAAERLEERKRLKLKRHGRRDRAHGLRVARFDRRRAS